MNIVIFIESQLENYLVCIIFLLPVRLQYQEHVEACEEPVQDKQALEAIDRENEINIRYQLPFSRFLERLIRCISIAINRSRPSHPVPDIILYSHCADQVQLPFHTTSILHNGLPLPFPFLHPAPVSDFPYLQEVNLSALCNILSISNNAPC